MCLLFHQRIPVSVWGGGGGGGECHDQTPSFISAPEDTSVVSKG